MKNRTGTVIKRSGQRTQLDLFLFGSFVNEGAILILISWFLLLTSCDVILSVTSGNAILLLTSGDAILVLTSGDAILLLTSGNAILVLISWSRLLTGCAVEVRWCITCKLCGGGVGSGLDQSLPAARQATNKPVPEVPKRNHTWWHQYYVCRWKHYILSTWY